MTRFPGYDVLARRSTWDDVTAGVVLRRIGPPPPVRFFSPDEEAVARPLLRCLLGLHCDDRAPVFEMVDSRLAERETDGWRYNDMPHDGNAWKQSMVALAGCGFVAASESARVAILEHIRTAEQWCGFPAPRLWNLWMRYACAAFYSHPDSWNEIGFGGPAYPTGYAAMGLDKREFWETADRGESE